MSGTPRIANAADIIRGHMLSLRGRAVAIGGFFSYLEGSTASGFAFFISAFSVVPREVRELKERGGNLRGRRAGTISSCVNDQRRRRRGTFRFLLLLIFAQLDNVSLLVCCSLSLT